MNAPLSQDETIAAIKDAAVRQQDRFLLKLTRKRGMTGLLEHIATLTDASVQHVANPETWIPQLSGGGEYGIGVYHLDAPDVRIGSYLSFPIAGEPLKVNTAAVRQPNWNGPARLIYPTEIPAATVAALQAGPGQSMGQPMPVMQGGYGMPPMPMQYMAQQPQVPPDIEQMRREAEAMRREAEQARDRANRELLGKQDEVRRQETELRLRSEMDSKLADLKAQAAEAKAAQAGNQGTAVAVATTLATAVGPLLLRLMESSQQRAAEALAAQARQADAALSAQRESAQQFRELLMATTQKGPSQEMQIMMEMMRSQQSGSAEMMSRMVDAMGTVSKTSVGMIEAIADLHLGEQPQGHPVLEAIREGVKAIGSLSAGATQGARRAVQQQQRMQMPMPPPPQLPPNPRQHPQQAPAQAAQVAPIPHPGSPVAQQVRPANGRPAQAAQTPTAPEPRPNMPAVSEVPAQAAFDGFQAEPEGDKVDQLEAKIRAHEDVAEVAEFFIDALSSDEMKVALRKYDGDFAELFVARLGAWAMADQTNREYVEALQDAIEQLAAARGLSAPEEDEPEQDDATP